MDMGMSGIAHPAGPKGRTVQLFELWLLNLPKSPENSLEMMGISWDMIDCLGLIIIQSCDFVRKSRLRSRKHCDLTMPRKLGGDSLNIQTRPPVDGYDWFYHTMSAKMMV